MQETSKINQNIVIIKNSLVYETAIILVLATFILFGLPFIWLWPQWSSISEWISFFNEMWFYVVVIIFLGMVLHELIHAISWLQYCKKKFKSIEIGMQWNDFTPYCHCKETLKVWQYAIGCALPGIILGLIPAILSLFFTCFICLIERKEFQFKQRLL